MTPIKRVFCPLNSKWFELIKSGRKIWEFRSIDSPVIKQVNKLAYYEDISSPLDPIPIEFRRGYSGESLLKIITEIHRFENISDIPFDTMHEGCCTPNDLIAMGIHDPIIGLKLGEVNP